MGHAPPACGLAHELQALAQGRLREHVEQPEAHDDLFAARLDLAGDQRLRVDRLPVGILHRAVEAGDLRDIGIRRDLPEQARAAQVGGDDAGDVLRHVGCAPIGRDEGRQREGQGFDHALGDFQPQGPCALAGIGVSTASAARIRVRFVSTHLTSCRFCGIGSRVNKWGAFACHLRRIPSGLKTSSTCRQWS
jgi:hypothetical protein